MPKSTACIYRFGLMMRRHLLRTGAVWENGIRERSERAKTDGWLRKSDISVFREPNTFRLTISLSAPAENIPRPNNATSAFNTNSSYLYDPRYLSGFSAEHYDISLKEGFNKAKEIAKNGLNSLFWRVIITMWLVICIPIRLTTKSNTSMF